MPVETPETVARQDESDDLDLATLPDDGYETPVVHLRGPVCPENFY